MGKMIQVDQHMFVHLGWNQPSTVVALALAINFGGQSLGGGAPMSTKLTRCSKLTAPATTVSAGFKHSAAVCNEDVYLWGANNQGLRWVKEQI